MVCFCRILDQRQDEFTVALRGRETMGLRSSEALEMNFGFRESHDALGEPRKYSTSVRKGKLSLENLKRLRLTHDTRAPHNSR